MYLCPECFLRGFCRNLKARLVSDAELSNPAFVTDVKAYAHALNISCDNWLPFLLDSYRDYPGEIVDDQDRPLWLETSAFDAPGIRYWFRDFCKEVPLGVTPRVRREAKERVRVMASILRAIDPADTMLWGVRAANDSLSQSKPTFWRDDVTCAILDAPAHPAAIRYVRPRNSGPAVSPFHPDFDDDNVPF